MSLLNTIYVSAVEAAEGELMELDPRHLALLKRHAGIVEARRVTAYECVRRTPNGHDHLVRVEIQEARPGVSPRYFVVASADGKVEHDNGNDDLEQAICGILAQVGAPRRTRRGYRARPLYSDEQDRHSQKEAKQAGQGKEVKMTPADPLSQLRIFQGTSALDLKSCPVLAGRVEAALPDHSQPQTKQAGCFVRGDLVVR